MPMLAQIHWDYLLTYLLYLETTGFNQIMSQLCKLNACHMAFCQEHITWNYSMWSGQNNLFSKYTG